MNNANEIVKNFHKVYSLMFERETTIEMLESLTKLIKTKQLKNLTKSAETKRSSQTTKLITLKRQKKRFRKNFEEDIKNRK